MIVCVCRGVSDRVIRAEIEAGALTLDHLAACTGAGSKCGTCRAELTAMIQQHAEVGPAGRRHLSVLSCDARDADAASAA